MADMLCVARVQLRIKINFLFLTFRDYAVFLLTLNLPAASLYLIIITTIIE